MTVYLIALAVVSFIIMYIAHTCTRVSDMYRFKEPNYYIAYNGTVEQVKHEQYEKDLAEQIALTNALIEQKQITPMVGIDLTMKGETL